jgi:hypothetical protein
MESANPNTGRRVLPAPGIADVLCVVRPANPEFACLLAVWARNVAVTDAGGRADNALRVAKPVKRVFAPSLRVWAKRAAPTAVAVRVGRAQRAAFASLVAYATVLQIVQANSAAMTAVVGRVGHARNTMFARGFLVCTCRIVGMARVM